MIRRPHSEKRHKKTPGQSAGRFACKDNPQASLEAEAEAASLEEASEAAASLEAASEEAASLEAASEVAASLEAASEEAASLEAAVLVEAASEEAAVLEAVLPPQATRDRARAATQATAMILEDSFIMMFSFAIQFGRSPHEKQGVETFRWAPMRHLPGTFSYHTRNI